MMGVARTGGGGLVLGLGTTSGQVFLVSIVSNNLLWLPLEVPDTSGKRRVKWYRNASIPHSVLMPLSAIIFSFVSFYSSLLSTPSSPLTCSLSWLVKRPDQLYLATGYSGGLVAIWRIDLNKADSQ